MLIMSRSLLLLVLHTAQTAAVGPKARCADGEWCEKEINGWAKWVLNYRKSHHCEGQVQTRDLLLSQSLYNLAGSAKAVLEVGAWRGCGSTIILAKGLMDQGAGPATLQTLEVNQERAAEARQVTAGLPVVNVTAAPAAAAKDILPSVGIKSGPLPPNMHDRDRNEYMKWWRGEHTDAHKLELAGVRPAIQDLCARTAIDVAFLDGGEFYGLADLHAVLRYCPNLRYIALDDTQTFKNYEALKELLAPGSGWQLCVEDKKERHGWAVVARSVLTTTNRGGPCGVLTGKIN